jgi:Uncharacterized protein conserved in bacteria (DUF2325)
MAMSVAMPVTRSLALSSIAEALVRRDIALPPCGPARRTKIWEFSTNLHCSIIGTCLSPGELRQILKKLGLAPPDSTDHDLHGTAVALAGRHDTGAKLLGKALDQRHKLAVSQFDKADTETAVRALWRDALRNGEIPGAYWATMTHPATTPSLIREAFGAVHMLSHLVGAANRADIRRLCALEAHNIELQATVGRQQAALHEAVVVRDATIRDLRAALAQQIALDPQTETSDAAETNGVFRQLVTDLERRLASETRRRVAADKRGADAQEALARERSARINAERDHEALRLELEAIEASLVPDDTAEDGDGRAAPSLDGLTLLYVGGRPHSVANLRTMTTARGATLLHHDGGIEDSPTLLPGLTSRADVVLFPVDCISHDAVRTVKTLCGQAGKRFVPLRSSGATSLLAALSRPDFAA